MFTIVCAGSDLQERLQNPEKYYPPEVCQELNVFLQILKRDGQLSKTDFYDLNTHCISGRTLNLYYRPNSVIGKTQFPQKEVLIINLKMKAADIFKERFSIVDDWDDKDVLASIPQYDQPPKIIKALELIHQGVTNSYELGFALGHRGKKEKYVARHGDYAKHTLEQLKLITRIREGRGFVAEMTDKGRLIAQSSDENLKIRLLIEAMLSYPPVWQIIVAVSPSEGYLSDEEVLTDELVKKLSFPEELRSSDTSKRRSQTLKNWIKWISEKTGIPIRLCKEGVQLSIPMVYAENEYHN